jgi:toxin ParE1/3/4
MMVIISEKAKTDLIDLWEYTYERWSLNQADKYYYILIDSINLIAKNPNIGKSYENVRPGYSGFHVKSHIIFYKIRDKETIGIIRILHERMDLPVKFG